MLAGRCTCGFGAAAAVPAMSGHGAGAGDWEERSRPVAREKDVGAADAVEGRVRKVRCTVLGVGGALSRGFFCIDVVVIVEDGVFDCP